MRFLSLRCSADFGRSDVPVLFLCVDVFQMSVDQSDSLREHHLLRVLEEVREGEERHRGQLRVRLLRDHLLLLLHHPTGTARTNCLSTYWHAQTKAPKSYSL